MEFFLKSRRLQINQERTSSKILSPEICQIFQNNFPEQLSVDASFLGALSKQ